MYNACPLFGGVEVQMENAGEYKGRSKQYCLANELSLGQLAFAPILILFAASSSSPHPPFASSPAIVQPINASTAFTPCARSFRFTHRTSTWFVDVKPPHTQVVIGPRRPVSLPQVF